MLSDPLTLSIVSMITGMLIGAIGSALAVMISNDLHKNDSAAPSQKDIDDMCSWYEENYCRTCGNEKSDNCRDCHTYDGVPDNWKKGRHEK